MLCRFGLHAWRVRHRLSTRHIYGRGVVTRVLMRCDRCGKTDVDDYQNPTEEEVDRWRESVFPQRRPAPETEAR